MFGKSPLFWAEKITDISGNATSTHSTLDAAVTMHVEAGDTIIRQTCQRFNYQPGKSQQILMTGSIGSGVTGVTRRIGAFDASNGMFFELDGSTLSVATRKNSVDVLAAQADWNIDRMDGTGPSGVTLDTSKIQIFIIDYERLGTGRVRFGFNINGVTFYSHEFNHANINDTVYISTPNLPMRYEISSTTGTGDLSQICVSVASEGGQQLNGLIQTESTGGTHIDANVANTIYAVIGIRLKLAQIAASVRPISMSMIAETNDDFEWLLLFNPTVAGTFTYADRDDSAVQTAKGVTANTVTGGVHLAGGFASIDSQQVTTSIESSLALGSDIDDVLNEMVLCVRPLSTNADIQATFSWRELSEVT